MKASKKISVLGCGWLGLPLAAKFLAAGYEVKGSTTTPDKFELLALKGIKPFLINLNKTETLTHLSCFLQTDYLVIAFPPGIRAGNGDQYLQQIKILVQALRLAPVPNLLFISSTSVYPEHNKVVTESENLETLVPDTPLLQAENMLQEIKNIKTTILRLGGLVGGSRHPGRFLAGKKDLSNPLSPVNLIHLDDCIALITAIIESNRWGEIYNGCADEHPGRQKFYTAAAQKLNLPLPQFTPPTPADNFKIVSNQKIKNDLGYRFMHPDPMLFM